LSFIFFKKLILKNILNFNLKCHKQFFVKKVIGEGGGMELENAKGIDLGG
jgi:hypothetical protein